MLITQNPDQGMVLNPHLVLANLPSLHQEVDQEKNLSLHQDLVVGLILKLESMRWHTHQRDTLQIPDIRAYKDHLKKSIAQLHVLSMTRKCLYRARIQTDSKMSLCLVGVSDVIQRTIWAGIARRLLFHALLSAIIADTYIMTLNCVHISMTSPGLEAILEAILPILDQRVEFNQLIVPYRKKNDNQ